MPTTRATNQLPRSLQQLLESCPASGSGERRVHRWIIECLNHLRHHRSAEEAAALIEKHISRRAKPREIAETISKVYGSTISPRDRLPDFEPDLDLINQIVRERTAAGRSPLAELVRKSGPIPASTDLIVRALFSLDALICLAFDHPRHALTIALANAKKLQRCELIVPSPMSALYWIDPAGNRHARGLANTGPRFYLVTDFDIKASEPGQAPTLFDPLITEWERAGISLSDAQAAIIERLAQAPAPLTAIIHSGNQSLQAWWRAYGENEGPHSKMRAFFESAIILGCDPAGWVRCQLFRMPGAVRRLTKQPQEVFYFNPQNVVS